GSEFAFVVLSMVVKQAVLGAQLSEQLIAAVALSMLLTPLLCMMAYRWSISLCNKLDGGISNCPQDATSPINIGTNPVFIIGMNEVGKTMARGLKAHKVPYLAVDHD